MKKTFVLTAFIICLVTTASSWNVWSVPSHAPEETDSFPIPSGIDHQLFYIQRTPNINTIIYALNLDEKGKMNEEFPIKVFWIRYAEDSSKQELSFIQRNYAYGLKYDRINEDKYEIRFVSYKKYTFYLIRDTKDRKFKVYTEINGKLNVLNRIFLKIEGGTFWFPHVVYVEFRGMDLTTGKEIFTRFKP
jgi:hypothetical protein